MRANNFVKRNNCFEDEKCSRSLCVKKNVYFVFDKLFWRQVTHVRIIRYMHTYIICHMDTRYELNALVRNFFFFWTIIKAITEQLQYCLKMMFKKKVEIKNGASAFNSHYMPTHGDPVCTYTQCFINRGFSSRFYWKDILWLKPENFSSNLNLFRSFDPCIYTQICLAYVNNNMLL